MKLHERTMRVQAAGAQLKFDLIKFHDEHDLTLIEMLTLLQDAQRSITKHLLRAERHPDDPSRRADEA